MWEFVTIWLKFIGTLIGIFIYLYIVIAGVRWVNDKFDSWIPGLIYSLILSFILCGVVFNLYKINIV